MPAASRLLTNLTPRGRIVLAGSALALIALVFLGMQIAGRPSYSLISSGLDPATTGKVTAALDAKGITYELRNNGTALAVEKSQTAQARVAPAGAGLDGGSPRPPAPRRGPPQPARLRALRQAEARLQRLPAEGHLPARARGPDRPDDRAG